jgi:hypothetical protein
MLKLLKRLMRCRIVMINFEEQQNTVMRSELLQPRLEYRRKYRIS